ncbi:MAG: NifU family protein [Ignavibacteriaceae bacterium]|nr:NifU family protein [Ignavibacteriaceae bacterium]
MKEKVLEAINSIRPYLQSDDGDIELIEITEDAIVKIRLTGACAVCPMFLMTLRAGVERSLMRQVPCIKRVEAVN